MLDLSSDSCPDIRKTRCLSLRISIQCSKSRKIKLLDFHNASKFKPCAFFHCSQEQAAADAGIPKGATTKNHETPGKKISKDFFSKSVDILLFRRYNGERAVETAAQQNEKNAPLAQLVEQ